MNYVNVLDASHWVRPKWQAWLDAGYPAVYLKIAEGDDWADTYWEQHYSDAEAFYRGAYHFFHGYEDGVSQAVWYHSVGSSVAWDMKPVVDVEWYSGNRKADGTRRVSQAEFRRQLKAMLLKTEELWGIKPMIYTSKTMWEFLCGYDSWFAQYDLWTAHYTLYHTPWIPREWTDFTMWQYIDRPVDQNRWKGTEAEFLAWMGKVVVPPAIQVLKPGVYEVV